MKKGPILAVIAIIIVILFVVFLNKKQEPETYVSLAKDSNAVVLSDQKPNSKTDEIVVAYAKLSKPGYVVIYTKNQGSVGSEILGASTLLPVGEHFDIKIKRHSSSKSSKKQSVVATLVADNGDGSFDKDNDVPLKTNESGFDVAESEATLSDDGLEVFKTSLEEIVDSLQDDGYDVNTEASILQEDNYADTQEDEDFDTEEESIDNGSTTENI